MKTLLGLPNRPSNLFSLYTTGSFLVLLLTLFGAAYWFSISFKEKEVRRAELSKDQLEYALEIQYRTISEEMWTSSYAAISSRIANTAKQFGNASYSLILADENGQCVYSATSESPATSECKLPEDLRASLIQTALPGKNRGTLKFEKDQNNFAYNAALYVGAIRKGFLHATFSDPFNFYRGRALAFVRDVFGPPIVAIILLWLAWLWFSRSIILKPYLASLVQMEKRDALGKLAAQIVHDVQSDLATLRYISEESEGLDSTEHQLLRSATSRMQALFDDLLTRHRSPANETSLNFTLVSAVVDSKVAEKRAILSTDSKIDISTSVDPIAVTMGIPVSSHDLSRVLSNLLNNSLDALQNVESPKLMVRVHKQDSNAVITIEDNGKGMSPEVLQKVRTLGGTYGKANGSGLGLRFAKEVVVAAGGRFQIESSIGKGTSVMLEFPVAPTPQWCATGLFLPRDKKIVVLDDCESIHYLWKQRLQGHEVVFLKDPEEFDIQLYPPSACLYLFDYEIRGSAMKGLDLISLYQLGSNALLVTTYFDDPKIQTGVVKVGAKLFPKFLISSAEIISEVPEKIEGHDHDLVLIDNDPGVHDLWKLQAKKRSKKILTLKDEIEFKQAGIAKNIPVYVDFDLGNGKTGAEVAKRLHGDGYTNLYIASGFTADQLPQLPFLKGVVGKDFPIH